jgi:Nickel responsive protein SCO4226-like
MGLYLVERDVASIAPERLRRDQRDVATACGQLKLQGKRVRYISSAIVPDEGRALDLFGAESPELVKEAHAAAGVFYSRIVEILDLTPNFVERGTSRSRRSFRRAAGTHGDVSGTTRTSHTMTANSASELSQWLADGQRFFGQCLSMLENAEHLETRARTLESENEMLREEVRRLRDRVDALQAERSEMIATFNDLAGHVTQVVDQILQKSENGEEDTPK